MLGALCKGCSPSWLRPHALVVLEVCSRRPALLAPCLSLPACLPA